MKEGLMLMAALAALCAGCTGLEPPPVPTGERIPVNWNAGDAPDEAAPEVIAPADAHGKEEA